MKGAKHSVKGRDEPDDVERRKRRIYQMQSKYKNFMKKVEACQRLRCQPDLGALYVHASFEEANKVVALT